MDFSESKYAEISPLATNLFTIGGVIRVFYGKDFISVTKEDNLDWNDLKPEIIQTIESHYASGLPLFNEDHEERTDDLVINADDSEAMQMVKEIIQTRVRPFVQEDGGDITFVEFNEDSGVVYVELKGSCAGCPSSAVTLKNGIENMLKHYVAEVTSVQTIDPTQK